MHQLSFTDMEFELRRKTRKTRTERVTERLDELVPWGDLLDLIRPFYFESGHRGRQPFDLELMLRIHLLQISYNLSDPQMEDFLHENITARNFVGLEMADRTPDESTILQFRHLLEKHNIGEQIFKTINERISQAGLRFCKGRIVDASFIEAPSSTKNNSGKRDPEMASGKKGNTWHFGMKMHVATDTIVGIATDVVYGPANEHDISRARELISSDTEEVYGDAGYLGLNKRDEFNSAATRESPKRHYYINVRPGKIKDRPADNVLRRFEHLKSSVRCKVEHVFARVKLQMGYRKVRYRGIKKNAHRISTLLALANLYTWDCWKRRTVG